MRMIQISIYCYVSMEISIHRDWKMISTQRDSKRLPTYIIWQCEWDVYMAIYRLRLYEDYFVRSNRFTYYSRTISSNRLQHVIKMPRSIYEKIFRRRNAIDKKCISSFSHISSENRFEMVFYNRNQFSHFAIPPCASDIHFESICW